MYQNDCVGGWTSGGGGIPIEPPCCSWNGEEEIYEGMYDNDYEYSEQELKWIEEERREKEIEGKKQKERKEKERLRRIVSSKSKYGSSDIKYNGSICNDWFCHHCSRWVSPGYESWSGGIGETSCPRCGNTLVHCGDLD